MTLGQLLAGWVSVPAALDRPITGLALDSRRVVAGDLFFALAGSQTHGQIYLAQALAQGAAAVLVEGEEPTAYPPEQPILIVPHLTGLVGLIAARFYQDPARDMTLIGVTGTNGKTSITHLLAQVLQEPERPCGVLGTLGYGRYGQLTPASHTTPDPITLQRQLAALRDQQAPWVAMEVSSHALDQQRVAGIGFKVAVFTNLTRDHLDYHGDMERYGAAKRRLFHRPGLEYAVINSDDPWGRTLLQQLPAGVTGIGYGFQTGQPEPAPFPQVVGSELALAPAGLRLWVTSPWGSGWLQSPLVGRFNAANLLAVVATLGVLGWPLPDILNRLGSAQPVPGRMEVVPGGPPLVVVDYAHTPDALEQALTTLREHTSGQLWCVFGCGGERDQGKRPVMGAVAQRLADQIIVTDDNPRHEDPAAIRQAILAAITSGHAQEIADRAQAIRQALTTAQPADAVLIAGKGHEDYQQIGDQRFPFRDRLVVEHTLASLTERGNG